MKCKILCISLLASICIYAQESKVLSTEGKRHYNAAMTLFEMASNISDYMTVVREFEQVITSDPNYADTYFNLGKIYIKLGKEYGEPYLEKAKDAFVRYKTIIPSEANTADDELYTINLLQKKAEIRSKKGAGGYVDLGLPSETFWSPYNVAGLYTYEAAMSRFGNNMPTKEQWEELVKLCTWVWTGNGYEVTGPNGNSFFLPETDNPNHVKGSGHYWSSTPDAKSESCAWAYSLELDSRRASVVSYYTTSNAFAVHLVR